MSNENINLERLSREDLCELVTRLLSENKLMMNLLSRYREIIETQDSLIKDQDALLDKANDIIDGWKALAE